MEALKTFDVENLEGFEVALLKCFLELRMSATTRDQKIEVIEVAQETVGHLHKIADRFQRLASDFIALSNLIVKEVTEKDQRANAICH